MRIWLLLTAFNICVIANAQNQETDSLKKELSMQTTDIKRVPVLESLSYAYLASYPDTAMLYALQGLRLAQKNNFRKGEAMCTDALGNVYFHIGDNAKALEMYLTYLRIKEEIKDDKKISVAYYNIAGVYTEEADYSHALFYLFKAKQEDEKVKDSSAILYDLYSLGSIYLRMQKTDSALYYNDISYRFSVTLNDTEMMGAALNNLGETYLALGNIIQAAEYYDLSIAYAEAVTDNEVLTSDYYGLAKVYNKKNMQDSAVYYARKALLIAREAPFFKQVVEISSFLTGLYSAKKQFDSAFYYQQISIQTKDSLFNIEQVRKVQNLKFQEQERQQSIETARIKYQNKIKLFVVIFTSLIFLILSLLLWRNNKQKQKANVLLHQQKEKLETTLSELRSAQAQLIQSEKMASLGELTAGIAHEIQNPLNFVKNFSEVNRDMIAEMKEEINKGNYDEVILIAKDIENNEVKIIQHGKRAGDIVKGMLQHSRQTNGVKEPTDINALCDEYLRLSYHGLRAKDKSFNTDFKTDFDESIGKINIIPQDIGRVLLNLYNNAFYAVNEKKKLLANSYQPMAEVKTRRINNKVEITVTDNGNGITQNVVDKIFQPFFTTKPTGEGTGLGLSLSYDIIKAHSGEIKVESKEGEGSTFIIYLPY